MTETVSAESTKPRRRKVQVEEPQDRLPPHSTEAEQGVLGCILLAPKECMAECLDTWKLTPEWFYVLAHKTLFEKVSEMHASGAHIDTITLRQRLADCRQLEEIGGVVYLSILPNATPSAANLQYYVDILREKYQMRRMINACVEFIGQAKEWAGEPDALFDEVEKDITYIRTLNFNPGRTICEIVESVRTSLNNELLGIEKGMPTGFREIDELTGGMQKGGMDVIAAYTSVGKTVFAMNIANNILLESIPIGFISLETPAEQLVRNWACLRSGYSHKAFKTGDDAVVGKYNSSLHSIAKSALFIEDNPSLGIEGVCSKLRQWKRERGMQMAIIDYLQLLTSKKKHKSRTEEVEYCSRTVQKIAMELQIPVIVLSQINRESMKEGRKPQLWDLKQCGGIENDAMRVFLLSKVEETDDDERSTRKLDVHLAKNKIGPCRHFKLILETPVFRMRELNVEERA